MANHKKKEVECTMVHYKLCNGVKKKVLAEQVKYMEETGQYLSYPRAITRLILNEK